MSRGFAALAALLLAPWLFRALALLESARGPALGDLRGFLADVAVSLAILAPVCLLSRWIRWLGILLVGVLAAAYYANYETITALGAIASPLDLKFMADPTFVQGSAFALAHTAVLVVAVVASLGLAWIGLGRARASDVLLAFAGAGVFFGALSFWPADPTLVPWRQVNAIQYNVEWLAFREVGTQRGDFANPAIAMRELVPEIGADLEAPPRFAFDGRGQNVLLVVLERVSGGYLPTAARRHQRAPFYPLAKLDHTFSENIGYSTFLNHQRRTNRGLFALLCGEYPRLLVGMPKMSTTSGTPWRRCLPEILREHGYHTVYLQSASLSFMQKDRFMPAIGFTETLGQDWFEEPHLRTFWGVDDRTLFEQALEKLKELESEHRPWFVTMLNVGTHHPFTVPESFETPYDDQFRRAFNYMDRYFRRFLRQLENRGLRRDTLVLVTSDESRGDLMTTEDGMASILTENWGFLVALLPERQRLVVDEVFAQSDVSLSILDYLGLAEYGTDFFGRSVFRHYGRGRPIFYGNVNHRMIGGLKADGSIVQCQFEGKKGCGRYQPTDGRIFSDTLPRINNDEAFAETVREMARRSLPPQDTGPLIVPLVADPVFEVRHDHFQMVQGITQISVETDEWYEVDLEFEVRGEGAVNIHHKLTLSPVRPLIEVRTKLEPGQTLKLRYTVAPDIRVSASSLRTHARMAEGLPAQLVFRKRRFELVRGGERPPQGPNLLVAEIDPPPEEPARLSTLVTPLQKYRSFLHKRERRGMTREDLRGAAPNE